MITDGDKLKEVKRELVMRRRVYPRFVWDKKMTQEEADKRIAILEAIEADYERLTKGERLL